ncbi:adenosine deaminase [Antarcticirhabdus aurantiaca]|uniref:Adenosine deaminase n=1 Tax=Antarcticirhabdus aurantiaca TaxID=2606717 RepID=A0ACD4NT74_9HYPH|nr:adenosine deaminase [Antarcticirhabdus aurantiaca]WAJ30119.1 adenosine deaminase [Jeongeuplla avenae]
MTIADRLAAAAADQPAAPFPKAEIHCHVEGAAPVALARELAARAGRSLDGIVSGETYRWQDFDSFLAAYDAVAGLFKTPEDYERLALDYLSGLARQGAIYSELFVSPDHARAAGLAPADYIRALGRGAKAAEDAHGIVCRLIVVAIRHLGPERAVEAARFARDPAFTGLVTGFGLAGNERSHAPRAFAPAFDVAREAGLGLTAHAGEFAGADGVRETLDALKVSRLGHGVRAVEDEDLVRRIVAEGIVLETCPGSNIALGVYPSLDAHPLPVLARAGVRLTVNSDDPPFFATDLSREYELAAAMGLDAARRAGLTRTAIEAAFVDEPTRGRLLERLSASLISLGSG